MNRHTTDLEYCLRALAELANHKEIDEYSRRALMAIRERLNKLARGDTSNLERMKGYVARLVTEQDPDFLPPELGGRLIELERSFYATLS